MTEPATTAAASTAMVPVAGAALAVAGTASILGVEYMHVVAGLMGGVASIWFNPHMGVMRTWLAIITGTALATFGGPIAGPILAVYLAKVAVVPPVAAGNLCALILGTFATDLLAGGKGIVQALPAWIYLRVTGRPWRQGDQP